MGQCVMKDCGFSCDKLSSPQKKNLQIFLSERIKDRYHPAVKEMHTVEKFDKFLSEEEFAKSQNAVNTNFSLRIPNKKVNGNLPNFSLLVKNEKKQFNFDNLDLISDKNLASLSTKDILYSSKEQIVSKQNLNSINLIETFQNFPNPSRSIQEISSLKQIIDCFDKNQSFSQNEDDENQNLPLKGFENRMFNTENVDENFENIFGDGNNSFEDMSEEKEDFEKKFPENLIEKTSLLEKKFKTNQFK